MSFDDLINADSGVNPDADLTAQVEKHKEYVRRYQAKLRAKAKLMTIEKYIDSNPEHAIAYIKTKYFKLLK